MNVKRVVRNWIRKERNVEIIVALIRIALIIMIFATLSSCGAQFHLRRAIAKDPSIARDTIVKLDTAIVTEEKILSDTLIIHDTIVREIKREGVVVKLQKIHDTIMIEAICESDTIEIVKEVEVVRVIKEEKTSIFESANLLIRSLIALIVSLILFILLYKVFAKH